MSYFDNIANVTPTDRSPFFVPGEFVLQVLKTQIGQSQQGKGAYWVAEVEILASSAPARPVGGKMSWPMYFSTGEVVLANIKAFLSAVLSVNHTEITPAICEEVTGGDGTMLQGRMVRASAATVKTRKGTDFTAINWSTLAPEDGAEEIAKVNAACAATAAQAPLASSEGVGGSELQALLNGTP